jgi:hypothetical protein
MPSFKKDGKPFPLKDIEDSIKLGQEMINHEVIKCVKPDPRDKQSSDRTPKYVVNFEQGVFNKQGLYSELDHTSKEQTVFWLVLAVIVVVAFMLFRMWPLWLKKAVWYMSFYLLVFLFASAILRVVLWGILYHVGLEFWLFPNFFIDSNDPRDSFWPPTSFAIRDDMFDMKVNVLRFFSACLILYSGYQFCQDEKNL